MKHLKVLRSTLQVLCSILVLSVILCLPRSVFAANGVNKIINFQGKVTNANGTNVTDGAYDFVIKIYDGAGSGASTLFTETWSNAALWSSTMSSAPSSGGESLTYSTGTNESTIKVGQILWNTTKKESVIITSVDTGTNVVGISPTRQAWATTDTVTNRIYVKDGVFKVAINSLNANISGVNFGTDNIFMGVEFNGDGEMKPRIQYTATPYAMNAEKVNGLTVTNTSDTAFGSTTTLKIGDGKTVQIDNGLRFTGTDGTQFTFPNATGTVVTTDSAATLTNKIIGSGGLVFTGADSDISTTSNQHFSIIPNGTGNVGIGTTTPDALLRVLGSIGTIPTASFSANSSSATFITDNQLGDLFTASSSGLARFTITNGGGIMLGTSVGTSSQCLLGGATASWGSCGGGTNYWQQALGAVAPAEITNDLLVGGSATSSALVKFAGVIGTPDSYNKISGRATGQALFQLNETGNQNIFTASASGATVFTLDRNGLASLADLTLGLNDSSATISTSDTDEALTLNPNGDGQINFHSTSNTLTSGGDFTVAGRGQFGGLGAGAGYLGINTLANATARIRMGGDSTIDTFSNGGRTALTLANLGAGSYVDVTIDDGTLSVNGRRTGQALVQFDEEGDSDIFTASSSGVSRFVITNSGSVGIGTTTPQAKLHLLGEFGTSATASVSARSSFASLVVDNTVGDLFTASASGLARFSITNGGGIKLGTSVGNSSQCLLGGETASWGSCGSGTNYWQLASNVLAPGGGASVTDRVVFGGNTSTVHQFEVNGKQTGKALVSLNETGNQAVFTASVSGQTKLVIDSNGTDFKNAGVRNLYQSIITVNASGSADFTSIATALQSAEYGDTVVVYPGTYTGNVVVPQGVGLVGVDRSATIILGPSGSRGPTVTLNGNNVVSNLTVNGNASGWTYELIAFGSSSSGGATIDGVNLNGTFGDPTNQYLINLSNWSTGSVTVKNSTLRGTHLNSGTSDIIYGIYAHTSATTSVIEIVNNYIAISGNDGAYKGIYADSPGNSWANGRGIYGNVITVSNTTPNANSYAVQTASSSLNSFDNVISGSTLNFNRSEEFVIRGATNSSASTTLKASAVDANALVLQAFSTAQTANLLALKDSAGTTTLVSFDESGNLRIGANAPDTGLLSVTGAFTGKALAVLNETGNQNIFTASASGVTKFSLNGLGTNPVASVAATTSYAGLVVDNTVGDLFTASASGLNRFALTNSGGIKLGTDEGDSGECLKSGGAGAAATWGSCGSGSSLFTADGGGVFTYLTSTTQDLLLGGSTVNTGAFYFDITNGSSSILSIGTDGSKNGVINLYSATTGKTASISNDASGNLTLAAGTGGSVIVGSGTGDINIEPGADDAIVNLASTGDFFIQDNGLTYAVFDDTGAIGFGTTAPRGRFEVLGLNATTSTASISASSTFAGLVVDNSVGDIFTASSSGLTRFVISNSGNVGIGLTNPTGAKFTISDSSLAPGVDMALISATTGVTTTGVDGLQIDIANSGSSAITNSGLTINVTSNNTNASSILYGLNIGNLSSGGENSSEYALNIGTGWDRGIIIGSGGSTNSGLIYVGSGRPTKTITLSPEFPGAVLTASGSATTNGSMTSDASPSAALSNYRTYYEWNSSETSLQDYTIVVRFTLPEDFSDWATTAMTVNYNTELTTNNTAKLDFIVYNADASLTGEFPYTPVAMRTAQVSAVARTWTSFSIPQTDLVKGQEYDIDAAGEQAVFYIKLYSKDNNHVQLGDIELNYLAKF